MPITTESIFYMCMSYCQMKRFDNVQIETKKCKENCMDFINMFVTYLKEEDDDKRAQIVRLLDSKIEGKDIDFNDDLSRLVISSIYVHHKSYPKAYEVINSIRRISLIKFAASVGILILMNRVDLAKQTLARMSENYDYSELTQLMTAQVLMVENKPAEAYDYVQSMEENYMTTPNLKNLLTAAAICMGDYKLAREQCEKALEMDTDNTEALINMNHILSKQREPIEIRERYLDKLLLSDNSRGYTHEYFGIATFS